MSHESSQNKVEATFTDMPFSLSSTLPSLGHLYRSKSGKGRWVMHKKENSTKIFGN